MHYTDLLIRIKIVKKLFVNLVDLVDMPNTGLPVRHFKTEKRLSRYTKRTEKIMPRDDAHAGGILKYLLRQIRFPRKSKKDKDNQQKPQV